MHLSLIGVSCVGLSTLRGSGQFWGCGSQIEGAWFMSRHRSLRTTCTQELKDVGVGFSRVYKCSDGWG